MTSFNSRRNKLKYIDTNVKNTSINVNNQNNDNKNFIIKINKKPIYNFSKTLNNLSSDWEDLDVDGLNYTQYKNWILEFSKFDIRLLPFIDIKILYRRGENLIDDKDIIPTVQKMCSIADISNEVSDYIKNVTIKISFMFSESELYETYQVKLNVLFINPRNYI